MSRRLIRTFFSLALIVQVGPSQAAAPAGAADDRQPVDAAAAARTPAPGTSAPSAIAFTPDGQAVTYLNSESHSLSRVLWKVDVKDGGKPRIIARAPGAGDTEANVSPEEALRRERQRLQDTGITHVVRARDADVLVIPIAGDLYLKRSDDGPLERLTETKSPEIDPQLTRDGAKVAFVRDGELYVLDLKTKKETQLSQGAGEALTHGLAEFIAQEELGRSTGFWWSLNGSKLAYQETDERHIPLYTITHQGGEQYSVETHRYPFAGKANAKVRLGVVSAEGGDTRWLTLAKPDEDNYLARVDWEDEKHLLVQLLSRDQQSLRLLRIDVENDASTLLLEESSDTWVNLHDDLRTISKTGEFLWSSERSGFRHLELHSRDGDLLRVLTSGNWAVDGVVALDEKRNEVWFKAGRESPLEMQLYRVSLEGGPVERVTKRKGMHAPVVARDGEHFVDIFSSGDAPAFTTVCERSGRRLTQIDDAGDDPRLKSLRLIRPVLTEFKNRDGETLYGAYYAPRSPSLAIAGKSPLVVMVYGGPLHQSVTDAWGETADLTAQFLAERGFAVWKADNRGSSRRGHAFEAALFHNMGDVEVRDQVDGAKFAAASWPEVDAARVGITGKSYGGYMTLRAMELAPEVFRAGVSIAPVTDWDGYDTAYTERYMGTPEGNRKCYAAASVLERANDLTGALLVIHGMIDENVHFRHTARLATAMIGQNRPFALLPLPDERHSLRREADRKYIAERLAAFFEEKLGPAQH